MAAERDAEAITAIYAPFCESTAVSFETEAPTPATMAERIRTITAQYPWLVFDDGGVIGGYAYASRHRERAAYQWAVDVAVYVAASHRRRGVGRTLYSALFDLLVRQGYYKAYGGIALPNPGSVGLHVAMGFDPVGVYRRVGYKLGAWHDVAWYQKTLQPERAAPSAPIPITALERRPGL